MLPFFYSVVSKNGLAIYRGWIYAVNRVEAKRKLLEAYPRCTVLRFEYVGPIFSR